MTSDLPTFVIVVSTVVFYTVSVDWGVASKGDFWIMAVWAGFLIALLWAYRIYKHESRLRATNRGEAE